MANKLKWPIIILGLISIGFLIYDTFKKKPKSMDQLTICDCVAQEHPEVKQDSLVIKQCLIKYNLSRLTPEQQFSIQEQARSCADSLKIKYQSPINISLDKEEYP